MLKLSKPFQIIHFPSIDSTQTYAETHIDDLVIDEWRAIIADQQLQGQGTHGRAWYSPAGNVSATFSIKISAENILPKNLIRIPQLVAISVIQVLKDFGLNPQYKWVNDILINEKKIAGILCSSRKDNHGNIIIHIGIGMNVSLTTEECQSISQPITSLNLELDAPISAALILNKLQNYLTHHFNYFICNKKLFQQEELDQRLAFKNSSIVFELENHRKDSIKGTLKGIDENGFIIIQHADSGKFEKFITGRILTTVKN